MDEKISMWTKPYEGISHFGYDSRGAHKPRWSTVTQWADWIELHLNMKNTFEHQVFSFTSMDEAKKAGEAWAKLGSVPEAASLNKAERIT